MGNLATLVLFSQRVHVRIPLVCPDIGRGLLRVGIILLVMGYGWGGGRGGGIENVNLLRLRSRIRRMLMRILRTGELGHGNGMNRARLIILIIVIGGERMRRMRKVRMNGRSHGRMFPHQRTVRISLVRSVIRRRFAHISFRMVVSGLLIVLLLLVMPLHFPLLFLKPRALRSLRCG